MSELKVGAVGDCLSIQMAMFPVYVVLIIVIAIMAGLGRIFEYFLDRYKDKKNQEPD